MSKSRKDNADFRSGSESLFRAVRGDHDASAADFARVEAELARRIAIGAPPKLPIDGVEAAIAKPASVLTPGMIAKLSIGLSLLAAGSFAIVRVIDSAPAPASRAASALAPAGNSVRSTSRSGEEMPPAPRREPPPTGVDVRPEPSARVEPSRTAQRESASPKRSSTNHNGTARSDASVVNEASAPTAARVTRSDAIGPTAAGVAKATDTASVTTRAASPSRTSLQQPASNTATSAPAQPRAAVVLEPPLAATETSARTNAKSQPLAVRFDDSAEAREELDLVERMHAALRAGKPAAALELCGEHAKRWPHGSLTEEREAVNAIASCVLRTGDAALRARNFLSQHPHAPTAPRVVAACTPLSAATKPASSD